MLDRIGTRKGEQLFTFCFMVSYTDFATLGILRKLDKACTSMEHRDARRGSGGRHQVSGHHHA